MLAAKKPGDRGAVLAEHTASDHRQASSTPLPSINPTATDRASGNSPIQSPESKAAVGQVFGDYELIAEIARGGMGVVFKARQRSLNRIVALKMIRDSRLASPQTVQRFRIEAEAAAKLDHPQIVPIYEFGQRDGQYYFSMKLVEGASLAAELHGVPMDAMRVATTMALVARAIHYAHQRGVLHRDLKPANILLDARGQPHVTDFGLAKFMDGKAELTLAAEVVGSPNYMSPEQAAGRPDQVTTATDVYSLGAILYELLTGRVPFRADTPMETLRKVMEEEPARPRTLYKFADRDLETICLKCMEKDPARRYGSALALAEDLERWSRHEPIQARPVNVFERVLKWARRNPKLAVLIFLIHVVLGLGLGGVLWMSVRLAQANKVVTAEAEEGRQRLVRMHVAAGERLLETEYRFRGLLYFTEALRLDQGNPAREDIHRYRIASVLQNSPKLAQILFHERRVETAEFSPDGQRLVTGSADHTARVWNLVTGEAVTPPLPHDGRVEPAGSKRRTPPLPHRARVEVAQFSPDGRRIVTMTHSGVARLWDANSGKPLSPPLRPVALESTPAPNGPAASFSPDGRSLLTAGGSRTAQIIDAATGRRLHALLHPDVVNDAKFSPDGRRALTACRDKLARFWDAASGREIGPTLRHTQLVAGVAFSPDGRLALTITDRRIVHVWDSATGRPVGTPIGDDNLLLFAAFMPESQRVLTSSSDNTVRIWNAMTGNPLDRFDHNSSVMHVAFQPRTRLFAAGCWDGTVVVWDEFSGQPATTRLPQGAAIAHVAFSPDGRYLATASREGAARVWALAAGNSIAQTFPQATAAWAEFSQDEKFVVTAGAGSEPSAQVWDAATGKPVCGPLRHAGAVQRASFSPDGRRVLTMSEDKTVRIWALPAGTEATPPLRHGKRVRVAMWSPDGSRVLTACEDGKARLWDAVGGQEISPALSHKSAVTCAAFSPDGRLIVTASQDSTARIWNTANGQPVSAPLPHNGDVAHATFNRDASRVLTIYADRGRTGDAVRVWNVTNGQPATPPLKHDAQIAYAEFSPEGERVVTASDDGRAKIWDAATGKPVTPPLQHHSGVKRAIFSPDGRRVATGTEAGVVQVWDAVTGEPVSVPFRHVSRHDLMHLQFGADGKRLLIASGSDAVWVRQLGTTERPVEDLILQAEILSGHRVDAVTGLVPLDSGALSNAWRTFQEKYPDDFRPVPPLAQQ